MQSEILTSIYMPHLVLFYQVSLKSSDSVFDYCESSVDHTKSTLLFCIAVLYST